MNLSTSSKLISAILVIILYQNVQLASTQGVLEPTENVELCLFVDGILVYVREILCSMYLDPIKISALPDVTIIPLLGNLRLSNINIKGISSIKRDDKVHTRFYRSVMYIELCLKMDNIELTTNFLFGLIPGMVFANLRNVRVNMTLAIDFHSIGVVVKTPITYESSDIRTTVPLPLPLDIVAKGAVGTIGDTVEGTMNDMFVPLPPTIHQFMNDPELISKMMNPPK